MSDRFVVELVVADGSEDEALGDLQSFIEAYAWVEASRVVRYEFSEKHQMTDTLISAFTEWQNGGPIDATGFAALFRDAFGLPMLPWQVEVAANIKAKP